MYASAIVAHRSCPTARVATSICASARIFSRVWCRYRRAPPGMQPPILFDFQRARDPRLETAQARGHTPPTRSRGARLTNALERPFVIATSSSLRQTKTA